MNSLYVYEVSIILLIDFTIDKEDLNWIYVDSTIEISMDSTHSSQLMLMLQLQHFCKKF